MKTAQSQAYHEAINAPTFTVASHALASAMVTGKRIRTGSVFGTFSTIEKAMDFLEDQCKVFAPAGKNLKTGEVETIRSYKASVVETVRGASQIVFPVK